jgi:uncharacterized protein with von Willebrand factor type A (vWA) domain
MLAFAGMLRAAGLPVPTSCVIDSVAALEFVDLADRQEFYLALRTVLVSRTEEQVVFDRCFEAFFNGQTGLASPVSEEEPVPGPADAFGGRRVASHGDDLPDGEEEPFDLPGGSERELLMEQDFSSFAPEQLDEIARLTMLIARRLARRVSRRRKPAKRRGTVDLRRSMRANVLKGDIIELRRLARRRRKPSLVLLCDVSGSMDVYSRFLLQFLYALQNSFGRVETFTFATRLTRVSDLLRGDSYRRALGRLAQVHDWAGGTRIGESLREFNAGWSHLIDRRSVVLILSDGWDTGEPDLLADEMLALKRRAARVIWLNPLLGSPGYEPLNRGMAAALPFVHRFAAAHNLASLRELASRLVLR